MTSPFWRPVILSLWTLAACFGLAACQTGGSDVKLAGEPVEDAEYYEAFKSASRHGKVIADFETRYQVWATYLSPSFRNAFSRRIERVFAESVGHFEEASARAGFFVSVTAPDDRRLDLANEHHWSIQLSDGTTTLKPVMVKRLNDKERWRAFFDTVNTWTIEYLVVFDSPSVATNSPELVQPTNLTLKLANADGRVTLSW